MSNKQVLLAKSVVGPSGASFHFRVVNLADKPVTLYKKTVAGICEPVDEVEHPPTERVATIGHGDSNGQVPSHLAGVCEGLEDSLTTEQHSKVQQLLTKYQRTLATTKNDICRAHLFQHKIPTGDSNPIRQNPRRLPYTKREDCSK